MSMIRRTTTTAVAATLLTLGFAGAAQAHVRVIPESTAAGGFTKLTFRVPSESDTANTTKVSIEMPARTPLAFVTAEPVVGWALTMDQGKLPTPVTIEGTTLTEATTKVTWTATAGHELTPGQFQEFALLGGPIPAAGVELGFPAEQTYSDGTVVKWDEPQPAGAAEPEHPLPAFMVTAAEPEGVTPVAASPTATSEDTSDDTARWLGGGGLVAGLISLVLGGLAWRRSSTRAPESVELRSGSERSESSV